MWRNIATMIYGWREQMQLGGAKNHTLKIKGELTNGKH